MLVTMTGEETTDFSRERFASGFTVVTVEMELFELARSTAGEEILAVLVSNPTNPGFATMVTVATAPLDRLPKLHVTTP